MTVVPNKNARCEHNINASLTLTCACVRVCVAVSFILRWIRRTRFHMIDAPRVVSRCTPPPQSLSLALSLYPVGNASRSHIRHSAPHHGRLRAHKSMPGKRTVGLYLGVAAV